jgi:hypothetical protein
MICKKIRAEFLVWVLAGLASSLVFIGNAGANPLEGYKIHVTAPHMMNGEVIGPFHHYCKPINSDIIQCILFESTDANARMTEVEYMVSKKLARSVLPKWSHLQNWHDHQQEIETGRVAIHTPSDPKEQAKLAEYVGKTDGIIFHLWPEGAPFPDGSVMIAQSIGHWEATHGQAGKKMSAPAAKSSAQKPSGGISKLTDDIFKRMGIAETRGSFSK